MAGLKWRGRANVEQDQQRRRATDLSEEEEKEQQAWSIKAENRMEALLHEGDKVTIRPRAKGIFTFKDEMRNQFLVSTVTGVVPYVSFLRDYIEHGKSGHHFYVLEGASYTDEFVYDKEFENLSGKDPSLVTFVPTISRPDEAKNSSWAGDTGRVNNIVKDKLNEFNLSTEDTMIYACGHPGMIEDVKEKVTVDGYEFLEERFWKDD